MDINVRWKEHRNCLNGNRHRNEHLQRAWNKYGIDNFKFNILFYTDEINARMFEQRTLDRIKPEYNIEKEVNGVGCRRSEETKRKVSKTLTGRKRKPFSEETKLRMSKAKKGNKYRLGTKQSAEARAKITAALTGEKNHNFGRDFSEEHRQKIGEAGRGRKMSEENKKDLSERMMGNKFALGCTKGGWKKGKEFSKEHKHNLSLAGLGRKMSKESIEKRTATRLNNNNGFYMKRKEVKI